MASHFGADEGPGIGVTVIEGDQFYAGGSAPTWDRPGTIMPPDRFELVLGPDPRG